MFRNKYVADLYAKAYIEEFRKANVYVGLIKRMEAQFASPVQIKKAIQKKISDNIKKD